MKKVTKANENLLSEQDAAAYLNVSYEKLRKSLRPKKKIAFIRISNSVRYKRSDLDTYVEKCRVEAVN